MKKSNRSQGNILIVAMILIVVVGAFVGISVNSTNSGVRASDRAADYATAQAAAEGAIETAYAYWRRAIINENQYVTTKRANTGLVAPVFAGLAYAPENPTLNQFGQLRIQALDEYGAPKDNPSATSSNLDTDSPTRVMIDLPAYPGWRGRAFNYQARTRLVQNPRIYNFEVGIKRQFSYAEVPLFQAMFFFENNIEFYRPAEMIISGLVHTNSFAYMSGQSSASLTFQDDVSYVTGYSSTTDPPYANMWSGYVANAKVNPIYPDGYSNQVHQVSRMEPLGNEPQSVLNTTDTNPNNDSIRELIEPPVTGYTDPAELSKRRLYNKAGLLVEINGSNVTVTGQNGTTVSAVQTTAIKGAIATKTTIYDQREGKNVEVTNVDVSVLKTTLNAGVSGFNNTVYIHDTTPLTAANSKPKTIRLVKGGELPDAGLTVVSQNPIYIQGDYNTGTTTSATAVPSNNGGNANNTDSPTVPTYTRKPSAVIGDAVMFLSNSWSDANSNKDVSSRVASNTTYNTAIVSGFMPSGYQPTTGAQYGYSGGANNFPRFLENWDNKYCTYFGSMVQLYTSKVFTGEWDTGVIYRPPLRRWNFDPNFKNVSPPGSLDAVSWSRSAWSKF